MSQSIRINCDSTEGLADLLRLLVVNTDCTEYLDCDNKDDSIESIVKRLVSETEDGQLALNVCGCPEATDVVLTYQSIYVPWTMMKHFEGGTEMLLPAADFCQEGGATYPAIGILFNGGNSYPLVFSVILPRELETGSVVITPIFHIVTSASYTTDALVIKLEMTHHPIGEVMGTLQTSKMTSTDYDICLHLRDVGDAITFPNCSPRDAIHCLIDYDATNIYDKELSIMGVELVFTQNGEIGSDTVLI